MPTGEGRDTPVWDCIYVNELYNLILLGDDPLESRDH